jgi:hypothetical protein
MDGRGWHEKTEEIPDSDGAKLRAVIVKSRTMDGRVAKQIRLNLLTGVTRQPVLVGRSRRDRREPHEANDGGLAETALPKSADCVTSVTDVTRKRTIVLNREKRQNTRKQFLPFRDISRFSRFK